MIIEAVGRRGIHRWRNKWTGEEAFAPIRGRGGERRDIYWSAVKPFTIVIDPSRNDGELPFRTGKPMAGWEPLDPRMMWRTAKIGHNGAPALSRIMAKLMPRKPFAHWKEHGFENNNGGTFLALSTVEDFETARKLLEPIPDFPSREWNNMTN